LGLDCIVLITSSFRGCCSCNNTTDRTVTEHSSRKQSTFLDWFPK